MRTLLLLGLAAAGSLWSDASHAAPPVADSREATAAYAHPPEAGTTYMPATYEGGYQGDGYYQGSYDPNRSYRYDDRYSDAELARMCRSDGGLAGAVVGGVVGGVIGNRVAGRGDRGLGTAVGAVAGAAVGGTVDRLSDKQRCENYQRRVAYEREYREYYNQHYAGRGQAQHGYYQGGYGYYTVPETTVTTEYVPYTTTTTTTETSYDYVYPQARTKRVLAKKRVYRPKKAPVKRPACVCGS